MRTRTFALTACVVLGVLLPLSLIMRPPHITHAMRRALREHTAAARRGRYSTHWLRYYATLRGESHEEVNTTQA